ncbi:hypothetical protein D3C72_1861880 [compost metagenome]
MDVILGAHHHIEIRNADSIFAVVGAIFGFGQLRRQPGGAAVKAQPEHRLTEHVQLYAAVTLLAIQRIIILAVEHG